MSESEYVPASRLPVPSPVWSNSWVERVDRAPGVEDVGVVAGEHVVVAAAVEVVAVGAVPGRRAGAVSAVDEAAHRVLEAAGVEVHVADRHVAAAEADARVVSAGAA